MTQEHRDDRTACTEAIGAPARRERVWRYIAGVVFVVVGGIALNVALLALFRRAGYGDVVVLLGQRDTASLPFAVRLSTFAYLMLSLIVFLPVMRMVFPALHRRAWLTFLVAGPWRWRRLAGSFGVMTALLAVLVLAQVVAAPNSLIFQGNWREIGLFTIAAVALVPLQVLTEETFFRGYLMQMVARITPLALIQIVAPAVLFTVAHWQNPEAREGAEWAVASYASAGLYLGLLAWLDRGIESAVGAHLAINVFAILVVGSSASVSPSSVIWRDPAPDYRWGFISGVAVFAVHLAILFKNRWTTRE